MQSQACNSTLAIYSYVVLVISISILNDPIDPGLIMPLDNILAETTASTASRSTQFERGNSPRAKRGTVCEKIRGMEREEEKNEAKNVTVDRIRSRRRRRRRMIRPGDRTQTAWRRPKRQRKEEGSE